MAYIRVVSEDAAEGDLFRVYDEVQRSRGRISNILRVQSLHPKALHAHLELYLALQFGKGPLTRRQRELIAVVVSAANGCRYCVVHHGEALQKYVKDRAYVEQAARDFTKLALDSADRALCEYAVGLTKAPGDAGKQGVEALRHAGFSDEAILHATEVVAYFNFVNRLVQGLGVELETEGADDYLY